MNIIITHHAVDRFLERVAPEGTSFDDAKKALQVIGEDAISKDPSRKCKKGLTFKGDETWTFDEDFAFVIRRDHDYRSGGKFCYVVVTVLGPNEIQNNQYPTELEKELLAEYQNLGKNLETVAEQAHLSLKETIEESKRRFPDWNSPVVLVPLPQRHDEEWSEAWMHVARAERDIARTEKLWLRVKESVAIHKERKEFREGERNRVLRFLINSLIESKEPFSKRILENLEKEFGHEYTTHYFLNTDSPGKPTPDFTNF